MTRITNGKINSSKLADAPNGTQDDRVEAALDRRHFRAGALLIVGGALGVAGLPLIAGGFVVLGIVALILAVLLAVAGSLVLKQIVLLALGAYRVADSAIETLVGAVPDEDGESLQRTWGELLDIWLR